MKRLSIVGVICALVAGCATEMWPPYMANLHAGPSNSPVKAPLRESVRMLGADTGVPPDQARWAGTWSGWMGQDKSMDTKLVVWWIRKDEVRFDYSYGDSQGRKNVFKVEGKFVGEKLVGTLPSGTVLTYRMRENGELDMAFRGSVAGAGGSLRYGVLAKTSD